MNWGAWNTNKCSKANCCCCGDSCTVPTTTVATSSGTCDPTCTFSNDDAQIILSDIINSDFGNYSLGTTYTGPSYGDLSNFVTSDSIENLLGLIHNTDYTIRLWNESDNCYRDITVTTPDLTCPDACCLLGYVTYDVDLVADCQTETVDIYIYNVSGGDGGPYEYSIDGGANWYPDTGTQNEELFTNVGGTGAVVMVRDGSGCETTSTVPVYFPPEFFGYNWFSEVGDPTQVGDNDNIFPYNCVGWGGYVIKGSDSDWATFSITDNYATLLPLVDGQTYNIDIDVTGTVNGNNPRIWATENGTTIFDTNTPPGTDAFGPNTYTFTFTYNTGDDVRVKFGQYGPVGGTATFALVQFKIYV